MIVIKYHDNKINYFLLILIIIQLTTTIKESSSTTSFSLYKQQQQQQQIDDIDYVYELELPKRRFDLKCSLTNNEKIYWFKLNLTNTTSQQQQLKQTLIVNDLSKYIINNNQLTIYDLNINDNAYYLCKNEYLNQTIFYNLIVYELIDNDQKVNVNVTFSYDTIQSTYAIVKLNYHHKKQNEKLRIIYLLKDKSTNKAIIRGNIEFDNTNLNQTTTTITNTAVLLKLVHQRVNLNYEQKELYLINLKSNTYYSIIIYLNQISKHTRLLNDTFKTKIENTTTQTSQIKHQLANCLISTDRKSLQISYKLNNLKSFLNINSKENANAYFYINKFLLLNNNNYNHQNELISNDYELAYEHLKGQSQRYPIPTNHIHHNQQLVSSYDYKIPLTRFESTNININLNLLTNNNNNKITKYISFKCDYNSSSLYDTNKQSENEYLSEKYTTLSSIQTASIKSQIQLTVDKLSNNNNNINNHHFQITKHKYYLNSPLIVDCLLVNDKQFQLKIQHNTQIVEKLKNTYYQIEYRIVNNSSSKHNSNDSSSTSDYKREIVKKDSELQVININETSNYDKSLLSKRTYSIRLSVYTTTIDKQSLYSQPTLTNIECKMPTGSNYPLLGVVCAIAFLIFLLIAGVIIYIIIKKRYNGAPNYLRNFTKKSSIFKSNRPSSSTSNGHNTNNNSNNNNSNNNGNNNRHSSHQHANYNQYSHHYKHSSNKKDQFYDKQSNSNNKLSSFNNNYDEHDSIRVCDFEAYVQKMHADGDFGFAQLYDEICTITKAYTYSSEVALFECNRCKNRYSNILTYDHSRVKLLYDEKDESLGYINANYIDGYQKQNAYIATQGPMPNTFADFWRMIWEQNCSIIVMITNVREKGRIKCDQYWPDEGFELYGNVQVTLLHSISFAFYTKRIFTLKLKHSKKRSNSERLVYQYHFTDWPDHGVPYYILPVLTFIKKSSRANPEFGGPIVVHCSAGVGRTGTYIVVDSMMKQIDHKQSINSHTFLKHIRHQRNYLVQTEEQFVFIYDALLEAIKSGETELAEHNYKSYISQLSMVDEKSVKFIDKQFKLITEFKPKEYHISFAQMTYNTAKNRNQNIIPLNMTRVILSKKPGVDGSEYINATHLHGSTRDDEFIITQHPMGEIKSNFWQMVWDNNSNHVVALYGDDKLDQSENYWLEQGVPMKCDSFTVILKDETFDMDFVYRDFLLQSIDEDYEFNCRIISAVYWPDSCTPVKSAFDLINKVRQLRGPNGSSSGPIIVHDLYGSYRAATFCCLYTFQDLIQLESTVDVYELAKMYHLKRPGVWANSSNIMFLYKCVECLFEEHIEQQLKNDSHANISSNSSTSITTPCSSISPITILRSSQILDNKAGTTTTSSNDEPLYDNVNVADKTQILSTTMPNSTLNNLNINSSTSHHHDLNQNDLNLRNSSTKSTGRLNAAAALLFGSVLTKSSNLKRALIASVTHHHHNLHHSNSSTNNTSQNNNNSHSNNKNLTSTVIETDKHVHV